MSCTAAHDCVILVRTHHRRLSVEYLFRVLLFEKPIKLHLGRQGLPFLLPKVNEPVDITPRDDNPVGVVVASSF